jgi:hypothetical protein
LQILVFGLEVNDGCECRPDYDPNQLIPVEEGHTGPIRFCTIVKGRPQNGHELNQKKQIPPIPPAPLSALLPHCTSEMDFAESLGPHLLYPLLAVIQLIEPGGTAVGKLLPITANIWIGRRLNFHAGFLTLKPLSSARNLAPPPARTDAVQ